MADEQRLTEEKGRRRFGRACCFPEVGKRSHEDKRLDTIVWSALFVWAGLVLLAETTGLVVQLTAQPHAPLADLDAWTVFFAGGALILAAEIAFRRLTPGHRNPEFCTYAGAVVFSALALGSWPLFWPLALLAAGGWLLVTSLRPRGETSPSSH